MRAKRSEVARADGMMKKKSESVPVRVQFDAPIFATPPGAGFALLVPGCGGAGDLRCDKIQFAAATQYPHPAT